MKIFGKIMEFDKGRVGLSREGGLCKILAQRRGAYWREGLIGRGLY